MYKPLRLSITAPSGAGKSTTAALIKEICQAKNISFQIIKLAAPLYRIQSQVYRECGITIPSCSQNQRLLEAIAREMRLISATALIDVFGEEVEKSRACVLINDDLRDDQVDAPYLASLGFKVIKINTKDDIRASRLALRKDANVVASSTLDRQMERVTADFQICNDGSLVELKKKVNALVNQLIAEHGVDHLAASS